MRISDWSSDVCSSDLADACDLVERHHAAVGIDMDRLQQAGRGTTGPQTRELGLQGRDRAVHAPFDVVQIEVGHVPYSVIIVKRPSPRPPSATAPLFLMEKTPSPEKRRVGKKCAV